MTNPLRRQPATNSNTPAYVMVNDQQVPTDIVEYCAWLNAKERRNGVWIVVEEKDDRGDPLPRRLDWKEQTGSTDWLREKGLLPRIGRAA